MGSRAPAAAAVKSKAWMILLMATVVQCVWQAYQHTEPSLDSMPCNHYHRAGSTINSCGNCAATSAHLWCQPCHAAVVFRYRCQDNISQPFKVIPIVNELGRTRIECNVTVKSTFSSKMFALNVVVLVPVPDYTAKANILVTNGKAKYDATKKALVGGVADTI